MMKVSTEGLEPRLRSSALMILRRHGTAVEDLQLIENDPKHDPSCLIKGHRIHVEVNDISAIFKVRAGRWRGARADYPTSGAFISAFEEALHSALMDS